VTLPLILPPGKLVGVLGGGQLGSMFAVAARRLGYGVAVWDPDSDAPAHRLADLSITQSFGDGAARARFAASVDAVTLEWENVPSDLCAGLEQEVRVRPSSAVLHIIQDRIEQKTFLQSLGLAVPRFHILTRPDQLGRMESFASPFICKTARAGYDGKGQWTVYHDDDVRTVRAALQQNARSGMRWIVEELLPFEREVSLLVARAADGAIRTYPLVENVHETGILRQSAVPADLSSSLADQAVAMASRAVEGLNGIGVFCVEMFVMGDGRVLINEVAPRPHNSGHYTLDACTVSQFEQQVRALCGLPLGEVRLLSPAVMVNLIGSEVSSLLGAEDTAASVWRIPGAAVHLYGKREVRPRRKMGHVTFLSPTLSEALARAEAFRAVLHC
jgi:5-(carboxyamino)imidazole ribonucleotide synthase